MIDSTGFYHFEWQGWGIAVFRHNGEIAVTADHSLAKSRVMALLNLDTHPDWAVYPDLRQAVRDHLNSVFPAGFP